MDREKRIELFTQACKANGGNIGKAGRGDTICSFDNSNILFNPNINHSVFTTQEKGGILQLSSFIKNKKLYVEIY